MKVTADHGKCVGTGNCAFAAPDVFDQDEVSGLVIVKQDEPGEQLLGAVRQAARDCPSGAIEIVDA